MWLAAGLGLGIGFVLNMCADWLPHRSLSGGASQPPEGDASQPPPLRFGDAPQAGVQFRSGADVMLSEAKHPTTLGADVMLSEAKHLTSEAKHPTTLEADVMLSEAKHLSALGRIPPQLRETLRCPFVPQGMAQGDTKCMVARPQCELHPQAAGRSCDLRRVARCGLVCLISAGLAAYLQYRVGWSFHGVMLMAYCSLLLLIAVIDLEHSLIPNVLVGVGSALALGFSLLYSTPRLAPALWGAATGGGIFLLLAVARRNALGFGDVKLAALIGMMTGFPWVLQALALGIVLGGLAAGLLLLTRVRRPKQYMPYAPYLVAGCIATLLFGPQIAHGYASLVRIGGYGCWA